VPAVAQSPDAEARAKALAIFEKAPVGFERNEGQAPPDVKFFARGAGYAVYLMASETALALRKSSPLASRGRNRSPADAADFDLVRVQMVGANPKVKMTPLGRLPHRTAYYFGNDPAKWQKNVNSYAKVRYHDVYQGIDLVFYGEQKEVKSDWILAPGVSPRVIRLGFPGARTVRVDRHGNLVLAVDSGTVTLRKPTLYQEESGKRREVRGRYVMRANREVGFEASGYDPKRPLVIDPTFSVSTYLGGSAWDQGNGIAVDVNFGTLLVTGYTFSPNFPSLCFRLDGGGCPAPKVDGDGFLLIYPLEGGEGGLTAFFGGTKFDSGNAVAIDAAGNRYIAGTTRSPDFPVFPVMGNNKAFQTTYGGDSGKLNADGDVFVMKFDPGFNLVYATFLGGAQGEAPTGVAADASGNAYVTGSTTSNNFPTAGKQAAFQAKCAKCPAIDKVFFSVLNASGTELVYSTYFGGTGIDHAHGIAVDKSGMAYITGQASHDMPTTPNAFQETFQCPFGSANAFVAKFDPSQGGAGSLVWSTYLGGSGWDVGKAIAVDADGNSYVTGITRSNAFPVKNAMIAFTPPSGGETDHVFVSKLTPDGTNLVFSTLVAGHGDEDPTAIALDTFSNVYVVGFTTDAGFPTARPVRECSDCRRDTPYTADGFLTVLNDAGSGLLFSTFLGGGLYPAAIALDQTGNMYLTGSTGGYLPAVVNALQANYKSQWVGTPDAFVMKLGDGANFSTTSIAFGGQVVNKPTAARRVSFYAPSRSGINITKIEADPEFVVAHACGNSLVAGGSCDLDVSFSPTSPGDKTGALTVTHTGAGSPAKVALAGRGGLSAMSLAPVQLDFGLQPLGPSVNKFVTVGNNGDAPLDIGVEITSAEYQTFGCGGPVAPKANCSLGVSFSPAGGGDRSATMTIRVLDNVSQQPIKLTGQGNAPAVGLSTTSLIFSPAYQVPNVQLIKLTNTGAAPLTIASITPTGDYAVTDTCPKKLQLQTLAKFTSCTMSVTFTGKVIPKVSNERFGSVTIVSDAQGSPHVVKLSGSLGSPQINLLLTDNEVIKPVGTSSLVYANVKLFNGGNGAALLDDKITVDGDFTYEGNGCGTFVKPSVLGCHILFRFTPKATGPRTGTVTVKEITGLQHQIPITQVGTAPVATLSTKTLTFAARAVGTRSAAQTVSLTNSGVGDLNVASIISYGDFGQSNECPPALAPGGSCTISITSRPLSAGPRVGSVKITDDAGGSPQVISLSGAGQ
jgi:hypothetical protein